MAKIERMTIVFPEPMADDIRLAVEEGEYASISEVVRDAMRSWQGRRQLRAEEIARLREAWDRGKASGEPVPYDMDEIIAGARKRYAAQLKNDG